MKLTAKEVPYSSVVGGGLTLTDNTGRARFMVLFCGTTEGIEREENEALSKQIAALVNQAGVEVPDRKAP